MLKPTIKKGPASAYAGSGETIVEVWDPNNRKGCLINIRSLADGRLVIIPYRADPSVVVALNGKAFKVNP